MIGAGNVAGAAGAGAHARRGLYHGADHFRVLAHSEIIVRAPNHDVARSLRRMPDGAREASGHALEVGENPVAMLVPQPVQSIREKRTIIHGLGSLLPSGITAATKL